MESFFRSGKKIDTNGATRNATATRCDTDDDDGDTAMTTATTVQSEETVNQQVVVSEELPHSNLKWACRISRVGIFPSFKGFLLSLDDTNVYSPRDGVLKGTCVLSIWCI